jgi:hypothetical protein
MSDFQDIAQGWWQEPFFHLLYIGETEAHARAILDWQQSRPRFTKVERTAGSLDDFDHIAQFITDHELQARPREGVLIVILDLGPHATDDTLELLLSRLERQVPWNESTHNVVFLLTATELHLSFRSFIASISRHICGIGDLERCIESLEEWTEQEHGSQAAIDLRLPFSKVPSLWLKNIRHDYLNDLIKRSLEDEVARAGLWDAQHRIEFWHNALRNVLIEPMQRMQTLSSDFPSGPTKEFQERVLLTPFRLVLPTSVADASGPDMVVGVDYLAYKSPDEAMEILGQQGEAGNVCVLVQANDTPIPRGPSSGGARFVPTICVGETPLRMPWDRWRRELDRNLLGAFNLVEFSRSIDGTSFAKTKRAFWRPFCFRSLPEVVDEVIECMMKTYAGVRDSASATKLERLFRCIASVRSARGLYFESRPTTAYSVR